jgi:hypothetical protein
MNIAWDKYKLDPADPSTDPSKKHNGFYCKMCDKYAPFKLQLVDV